MQATDDRQQRSASAATEGTAALHELWRAVAAHPALVELSCRTKPAGYPTHARSHRPCPHSRQSDSMPQSHSNPLFAPRCHAQPNSTPSTALPRHVTPRHTTLHRTTPHHTTPHHIISHYANPPDPTKPLPTHHTPPRPAHPSPAHHTPAQPSTTHVEHTQVEPSQAVRLPSDALLSCFSSLCWRRCSLTTLAAQGCLS